jgi:hypothetical protein
MSGEQGPVMATSPAAGTRVLVDWHSSEGKGGKT